MRGPSYCSTRSQGRPSLSRATLSRASNALMPSSRISSRVRSASHRCWGTGRAAWSGGKVPGMRSSVPGRSGTSRDRPRSARLSGPCGPRVACEQARVIHYRLINLCTSDLKGNIAAVSVDSRPDPSMAGPTPRWRRPGACGTISGGTRRRPWHPRPSASWRTTSADGCGCARLPARHAPRAAGQGRAGRPHRHSPSLPRRGPGAPGYYEEITRDMPGRVLASHGIVVREGASTACPTICRA